MKRKGRRKHFQLFRLFIINGRIKKITSYETLDYCVQSQTLQEKVGDNDCQEKHKHCAKTKAITAKTIIVMSTTESGGNTKQLLIK